MNFKTVDFYNIFLNESSQIYQDLKQLNKDEFNSWFISNCQEYGTIENFNEVIPDPEYFQELINKGYEHQGSGLCHLSANQISILDEIAELITGYIKINDNHTIEDYKGNIITHSFNFVNNKIIDFSRINIQNNVSEDWYNTLPNTYYGILIPKKYIIKNKEKIINSGQTSLIGDYFLTNSRL